MASDEAIQGVAVAAIWELVSLLGFAPSVKSCIDCGRTLPEDEEARFDLQAGGLRCSTCPAIGRVLPVADVVKLRSLVAGNTAHLGGSVLQNALVADFVRYHAAEGSRIRSLDFLLAPTP